MGKSKATQEPSMLGKTKRDSKFTTAKSMSPGEMKKKAMSRNTKSKSTAEPPTDSPNDSNDSGSDKDKKTSAVEEATQGGNNLTAGTSDQKTTLAGTFVMGGDSMNTGDTKNVTESKKDLDTGGQTTKKTGEDGVDSSRRYQGESSSGRRSKNDTVMSKYQSKRYQKGKGDLSAIEEDEENSEAQTVKTGMGSKRRQRGKESRGAKYSDEADTELSTVMEKDNSEVGTMVIEVDDDDTEVGDKGGEKQDGASRRGPNDRTTVVSKKTRTRRTTSKRSKAVTGRPANDDGDDDSYYTYSAPDSKPLTTLQRGGPNTFSRLISEEHDTGTRRVTFEDDDDSFGHTTTVLTLDVDGIHESEESSEDDDWDSQFRGDGRIPHGDDVDTLLPTSGAGSPTTPEWNREHGNTWGSEGSGWDDLANKSNPPTEVNNQLLDIDGSEASEGFFVNEDADARGWHGGLIAGWTLSDTERYKRMREEILDHMVQKKEPKKDVQDGIRMISDMTHDNLIKRFPPCRPTPPFPQFPGQFDRNGAWGGNFPQQQMYPPPQMQAFNFDSRSNLYGAAGPPPPSLASQMRGSSFDIESRPQGGFVQPHPVNTPPAGGDARGTGFYAGAVPFDQFFASLGGEHCQCAKGEIGKFSLEVKNALAEFENARLPEMENMKLKLERVYREREREIIDKFESQLRMRDMALTAQGEELCALQEKSKLEIAQMEQHYLQVLDNETDRLKRAHRLIIQDMDDEIFDLKRRLLESEAEINEKLQMVATTQENLNEELAEKSALKQELSQMKSSVRICEAAFAQKVDALENEAEKVTMEDAEIFLLGLPAEELSSLMAAVNYMPRLKEVVAFMKSLNPGMCATLIEEHLGEIYEPSVEFLLKKVVHKLDTDLNFKEAFMRSVKVYFTIENALEVLHRFDSKEQMILLHRANLKIPPTEAILTRCLMELSSQTISRNMMKMASIPFEPVVKAAKAMTNQELRMFCAQLDRHLLPSDKDSLVLFLEKKDPGYIKELFKAAMPDLFTLTGLAMLITENLNMADRKKLMGGSLELIKPTAKAIARFESMLSLEEKAAIFKELKYSLSERQVESQIHAAVKQNPNFINKILKKKDEEEKEEKKEKEITVDMVFFQGPSFMMEVVKAILTDMSTEDILNVLVELGKVRTNQKKCCVCWNKKRSPYPCPHTHFF